MIPSAAAPSPAALRAARAAASLRYWLAVYAQAPRHTEQAAEAGRHVDEAMRELKAAREELEREARNG